MSHDEKNKRHPGGRPRREEQPRLPHDELDRLLVFGEVVPGDDEQSSVVRYPSYRELARRFGVSHSLIAQYAKKHNSMRRREDARARITAKADERLIELRADSLAFSKDDALRVIDRYLARFEKAVIDGQVRIDNPDDFDTMLRLKEFLQGGADSRAEVQGTPTLEELQARHRFMQKQLESTSAAMRGETLLPAPTSRTATTQTQTKNSTLGGDSPVVTSALSQGNDPSKPGSAGAPRRAPGPHNSEAAPEAAEPEERATEAHPAPHGSGAPPEGDAS